MPKAKKPATKSKLRSKFTEQNLLIFLIVVLLVCVGYLIFKESGSTQIDEPQTIEQSESE